MNLDIQNGSSVFLLSVFFTACGVFDSETNTRLAESSTDIHNQFTEATSVAGAATGLESEVVIRQSKCEAYAERLPTQAEGYELYVYAEGNEALFTLMTGTSRSKTASEIAVKDTAIVDGEWVVISARGFADLCALLQCIPPDTRVTLAQAEGLDAVSYEQLVYTKQALDYGCVDDGILSIPPVIDQSVADMFSETCKRIVACNGISAAYESECVAHLNALSDTYSEHGCATSLHAVYDCLKNSQCRENRISADACDAHVVKSQDCMSGHLYAEVASYNEAACNEAEKIINMEMRGADSVYGFSCIAASLDVCDQFHFWACVSGAFFRSGEDLVYDDESACAQSLNRCSGR